MLLVYVAGALTTSIFVLNVVLHKPIMDALLFSLAIAVGITPQLLPAVVSSSLAAGSRRMSKRKVLVKRLVCIEDLGNVDVLFTDKTGTLTAGADRLHPRCCSRRHVDRQRRRGGAALGADRAPRTPRPTARRSAGTPWTGALWKAPDVAAQLAVAGGVHAAGSAALRPRPHHGLGPGQRQRTPADPGHERCAGDRSRPVSRRARTSRGTHLATEFAAGNRVVAVATRPFGTERALTAADEHEAAPDRFPGVPGPAEARRRASPAAAGRPRDRGQGRSPGTTPRSRSRCVTTWA